MKISYRWLQDYFEGKLPTPDELAETLTMHSFEVEGIQEIDGDTVLDIDVLPNRTHDALSHNGIAREISTLFSLEAKFPVGEAEVDGGLRSAEHAELLVPDAQKVPRAMKRIVFDVEVKPSPEWLAERLVVLGMNSINNIVDATNYVMLETGQPVHAFDFDKLEGKKKEVSVRPAFKGEVVTTLDDETYKLIEDDLVVADSAKALDIAGIKGGNNSGIDENTNRVLLSVCNFDPKTIRKTSRRLNLVTDASKRFEQGLAPELTELAIERLSVLIKEVAGGRVSEDTLDEYPRKRNPYVVGVSTEETNRLLGTSLSNGDIEKIFNRLGFKHKKVNPREAVVHMAAEYVGVPYKYGASISYDAPKEFDCSSFTSFIFSQAGVGIPRISIDQYVFGEEIQEGDVQPGDLVFSNTKNGKIRYESVEFMNGEKVEVGVDHCGIYLGDGRVIHATRTTGNVAVEELSKSKMFENIVGYRRMSNDKERFVIEVPPERLDLRIKEDLIEEVGRVYGYENVEATVPDKGEKQPGVNKELYYSNKIRKILTEEGFSEVYTYPLVKEGDVELENPLSLDKKFLRKSLSGGLERSLELNSRYSDLLGLPSIKLFEIGKVFDRGDEHVSLGLAAEEGSDLELARKMLSEKLGTKIGEDVSGKVLEINLEDVLGGLPDPDGYEPHVEREPVSYEPFSVYPYVLRDIALWTGGKSAEEVQKVIEENAGELLTQITLFDTYEKDGRTSYAFRLAFQSEERTLSDGEVNEVMERVESALAKKRWEVR